MDIDKLVEVILEMCTAEQLANDEGKSLVEKLFNDVMLKQRKEFLSNYERGTNRGCGFNSRQLKLKNGWTLNLSVPRVREDADKLEYTLFDKYKRTTHGFEEKLEEWYKTGVHEKYVNRIMKMKNFSELRKKNIRKKTMDKYEEWMIENKEGYELIKVDCTEFNKKHWNVDVFSLYLVWGYKKVNDETATKCLGYIVRKGKECSDHWQEVTKHIMDNVDLKTVKLILSDMNTGLKFQLGKLNKPLQNCLWHRIRSICIRVKDSTKQENEKLFYQEYEKLKDINTREELKELLHSYDRFEYRIEKNKSGVEVQKQFSRMIEHYYEDNFTYFNDKDLLNRYGKKMLRQTMDIESLNSQIKYSMEKYVVIPNKEILIFRVFCFLEENNYL